MTSEEIATNMFSAVIKELEAIEAKATATVQMLLYNPAGIADHSQVLDEVTKWAQIGAEARDAKKFLVDKFVEKEK